MGLMKKMNLVTSMALVAIALFVSACAKNDGGGGQTVAQVPANTCMQPGAYNPYAGYPTTGTVPPGYPSTYNPYAFQGGAPYGGVSYPGTYGYGRPAPFVQPYSYGGSGCPAGTMPTCFPGNGGGGMSCVPQAYIQNIGYQGYNPAIYSYAPNYNYANYAGYFQFGVGAYFNFQYNLGPGGHYYPNNYVQGCNVNSFLNGCGFGGVCRQLRPGSGVGICVR